MRSALPSTLICASLSWALSLPAFAQSGPPAASTLEDIAGCALEGDVVFVVTGRDATTRRYKYAWDTSIDALCNAKGFAIGAPVKAAPARTAAPAAAPAPAGVAAVNGTGAAAADFPADAQALSADGVTRKISGRAFDTQLRDGTRVRLEYKANGYLFITANNGFSTSGPWHAEDGRICSRMKSADPSCNEVREQGQRLYLRRDNGEMIALDPR